MTIGQMDMIIDIAIREYSHASKTYVRGCFLNIAYGKKRFSFNLSTDYQNAYHSLQELRK